MADIILKEVNKEFFASGVIPLSMVLGISSRRVNQLLNEEGCPEKTEHGHSTARWHKWLLSRAKIENNPMRKIKIAHEEEKMKKTILERKVMEEILVNKNEIMREVMDILTSIRQTFMRLGRKVSAKIAMKPAAEVIVGIDAEVKRICGYFEDLYKRGQIIKQAGKVKVGRPTKTIKLSKAKEKE